MSTRTQIMVERQLCKFYVHSDGYPSYILPILVPFVNDFILNCGFDECYMMARMVVPFANEYSYSKYLSLGMDTEWHGDIKYAYIIRKNCIDVYKYNGLNRLNEYGVEFKNSESEPADLRVTKLASIPHNTNIEKVLENLREK